MVLAIECDGAPITRASTARDRDRLRQQHLEHLGWRFHRIWSSEWFHHHEAEIARALEAYRKAVERADDGHRVRAGISDGRPATVSTTPVKAAGTRQAPQRSGPPPVRAGRRSIADYSPPELVALIRWIESDTLLRTEDQLLAEAMAHLGFQRRGPNIVAAITDAIARARHPESSPPLSLQGAPRARTVPPGSSPRSQPRHGRRW